MTTQTLIKHGMYLRVGDIIALRTTWGVVRRITDNATHIECEEGIHVVPHASA